MVKSPNCTSTINRHRDQFITLYLLLNKEDMILNGMAPYTCAFHILISFHKLMYICVLYPEKKL
jgi:hypothetical protein